MNGRYESAGSAEMNAPKIPKGTVPIPHPQNRIGDEKMSGVAEENQDLANSNQREVESVTKRAFA